MLFKFKQHKASEEPFDAKIKKLNKIIRKSNNIVFIGGAGVSTESGIPDFRSPGTGLYSQPQSTSVRPEDILSIKYFKAHPKEFYEYYFKNLLVDGVEPNICHTKLVELEKIGKLKVIITQNIDGLHQKAGSKKVLDLHGRTDTLHCSICNKEYHLNELNELMRDSVPFCTKCYSVIKPDVILYGESLPKDLYDKAIESVREADVLILCGSSLTVNPVAALPRLYKGKHMIIINREPTKYDGKAELVFHDSIGKVFNEIII